MKTTTLHITNPSKGLLEFARKLQADKEAAKKELREFKMITFRLQTMY